MEYAILSFYKYIGIEKPEILVDEIREFCVKRDINGRILVAKEGINAAVSGKKDHIDEFKKYINSNVFFKGIFFKEQFSNDHAYHKLVVRVREEIVAFGYDVDLNKAGKHIAPKQLKEMLDNGDDIVLLDARNKYEYLVGKFRDAVTLPIKTFRELPKIKKLKLLKDKKIVMYCTGGVRCEKSSALLKEEGFNEVYQLEGGIINFVNQYPNTYFEGGCFVFDDRIVSHVSDGKPLTNCEHCGKESEVYYNCHNLDCDDLFISCDNCAINMNKTCSEECKIAPRQRPKTIKV